MMVSRLKIWIPRMLLVFLIVAAGLVMLRKHISNASVGDTVYSSDVPESIKSTTSLSFDGVDDEVYSSDRVCPKCGLFDCCELDFEIFDETGVPNNAI